MCTAADWCFVGVSPFPPPDSSTLSQAEHFTTSTAVDIRQAAGTSVKRCKCDKKVDISTNKVLMCKDNPLLVRCDILLCSVKLLNII